MFEKLANYTGSSLKELVTADYCFRIHGTRCYYVQTSIANLASSVSRDKLLSLGICIGKFTKTLKFRLAITALPILSQHARYRVWVKDNGVGSLTYGGHVLKAHIGRWSEDIPQNSGIVIFSMTDMPLAFGVTARSSQETKRLDPTAIAIFRQADVGEFLRDEDTLFATG